MFRLRVQGLFWTLAAREPFIVIRGHAMWCIVLTKAVFLFCRFGSAAGAEPVVYFFGWNLVGIQ